MRIEDAQAYWSIPASLVASFVPYCSLPACLGFMGYAWDGFRDSMERANMMELTNADISASPRETPSHMASSAGPVNAE